MSKLKKKPGEEIKDCFHKNFKKKKKKILNQLPPKHHDIIILLAHHPLNSRPFPPKNATSYPRVQLSQIEAS